MPPKKDKEVDPCLGEPHCNGFPRFSRVVERTLAEKRIYSDKTRCEACGKERLIKRIPDPEPAEPEEEAKPAGMTIADTNR